MREHKYTVSEIDRMRSALNRIYWRQQSSVEDRLRTYMLNGTEPTELEAEAKDKAETIVFKMPARV